ncbi:DinB family protein [Pedobacter sp. SYP-B3415]|uniref:DinB family protein n=1 Tax=Pedobacter sp. SYP-B3415 TaxID=2496641 RepID=UPI00101DC55E|nr:DinB family protein [Pedobacter sp. SYP-B3415]
MTSKEIVNELRKAFHGEPWHGNSLLAILTACSARKVFSHPVPGAHSVAELVLHLTAWTREVICRISGETAKEPEMGDWPVPQEQTENYWNNILLDFKQSNEQLIRLADEVRPERWLEVAGGSEKVDGSEVTCFELLNGLVQHHAYHAGQISLLCKY